MSLVAKVRESFVAEGVTIGLSATELEIDAFEEKHKVKLSPVLKEYFLHFNGTGEGNFGESGLAFFSLEEFKPVVDHLAPEEPSNVVYADRHAYPDCFVFSDYLLWCWGYAVKLNPGGGDGEVYKVTAGLPPGRQVASSFASFLELYLNDCHELLKSC